MAGTETTAADVAKETASPEAQAKDTGPVDAGGTTGLGEPRATGPADALPGDGPQKTLPGDMPGRQVVKAALRVGVYDHRRTLLGLIAPASIVQVAKADGDGEGKATMQAVFDEDGNLVGIVDPADITPVAGAGAEGTPTMTARRAPAADAADMTPQPPAETGTPAGAVADDGTVAKQDTQDVATVLKSIVAEGSGSSARRAGPGRGHRQAG